MARIGTQKRRKSVVRAAIAERVGVTQPYRFRLVPDKKAILVATSLRNMEDTRVTFERAADGMWAANRPCVPWQRSTRG